MVVQTEELFLLSLFLCFGVINADRACAPIQIPKKSVVCVCNTTYCDTVTRVPPSDDNFVVYTSSESGLRFNKSINKLQPASSEVECGPETLILLPEIKYQTVVGFGGAVTDSAGINWKSLQEPLQKYLIDSYFSDEGLQYNTIRVPIGGTDFSTHAYAYNEHPINDAALTNYTLSEEDFKYKIPMIKAAMAASSSPINVVASTWSPPPWMKTKNTYSGFNRLKPEYYQTYADYHLKFIEKYKGEGVPIWAITTTNEPTNGLLGTCFGINCLGWSAYDMGKWIEENLGPTIRNSTHNKVKILAGDDQRLTIPYWMNLMSAEHPGALKYIDGIALHYYTDFIAPAALLSELALLYPDKFLISTEGCKGSMWFIEKHVDLGSWQRAKGYILDIITDLNYGVVGWIDWNMCLNAQGGPTWAKNFVDSPIIVSARAADAGRMFVKQPMFYAMGHFSKFIPRGSRRIRVSGACGWGSVRSVAFVTPRDTVLVVLYNSGTIKSVNIKLGTKLAALQLLPNSVNTLELSYKEK